MLINCISQFCMPLGIISFTQHQFDVILTILQTEIPALLDSWITNTPSVKMLCQKKKNSSPYICVKAHLSASLLMISQVVSLSCKTVYRWVTTDACFNSDTAVLSLQNWTMGHLVSLSMCFKFSYRLMLTAILWSALYLSLFVFNAYFDWIMLRTLQIHKFAHLQF